MIQCWGPFRLLTNCFLLFCSELTVLIFPSLFKHQLKVSTGLYSYLTPFPLLQYRYFFLQNIAIFRDNILYETLNPWIGSLRTCWTDTSWPVVLLLLDTCSFKLMVENLIRIAIESEREGKVGCLLHLSPKYHKNHKNIFLFVGSTTSGTFNEFWLVSSSYKSHLIDFINFYL